MPPVRVFASFDIGRDDDLLKRLIEEGKKSHSAFLVADRSLPDADPEDATQDLCERMSRIDAVAVLCGEWTHRAENVSRELKMAQELGKRYYLVKGRKHLECSRPLGAHLNDKMYVWAAGVMKELVKRFR